MAQEKFIMRKDILILVIFFSCYDPASVAAQDTLSRGQDAADRKKLNTFLIVSGATYGAALVALNEIWYKNSPRESFHFFNDNQQWKQMDKAGHLYSTFQISRLGVHAFGKLGMSEKKRYLWGSLLGVVALTPIEILDGFSSEYGASWGDVVANVSGAGLVYGQYALWDELRIQVKYSFMPTSYATRRPEVLGRGLHEEFIKDYNGMTYWLSFDLDRFLKPESGFPKWLNIALGYGGEDMLFAHDASNRESGYSPYRQYYLAVDFDLSYISSRSKLVNTLLYLANMIHLPGPALEFNHTKGVVFHPIYF